MSISVIANCLSAHASSILTSILTSGLTTWFLTWYFKKLAALRSLIGYLGYISAHLALEYKTLETLNEFLQPKTESEPISIESLTAFLTQVNTPTIQNFLAPPLIDLHESIKLFSHCWGYYKGKKSEILNYTLRIKRQEMDYKNLFSMAQKLSEDIEKQNGQNVSIDYIKLRYVNTVNVIINRTKELLKYIEDPENKSKTYQQQTREFTVDIENLYSKWTTIYFFREIKNWLC